MSYKTDFLKLIIALFVLISLFAFERTALAAGVFGGRILTILPCFCPPALFITVGPPRAKLLMFVPGKSKLYAYGALKPGSWVLGTDGGALPCIVHGLKPCSKIIGVGKIINMIGTSQ